MIQTFRDLEVYQQGYQLALEVHKLTLTFPSLDRRDLASQLRAASKSIPLNVAEGYGRKRSEADFKRFLVMALGSCNEVQVELDFAKDLGYIDQEVHTRLVEPYEVLAKRIYRLKENWHAKSNF